MEALQVESAANYLEGIDIDGYSCIISLKDDGTNRLQILKDKKLLKGKTASIYATSMAPTWWYKIFSGPLNIPDSYGISVLKNAVLNHCGIKTKRVCILGEVGRDVNTASMREQHLQKVAEEVFADRGYNADGTLVNRALPGAFVKGPEEAIARVIKMVKTKIINFPIQE